MTTETRYHYFVSYNSERGPGRCEVYLSLPICGMDDVEAVEKVIRENNSSRVVAVNNWVLFGS